MSFLRDNLVGFLHDIDAQLNLKKTYSLYLLGGSALLLYYGSHRSTVDIDLVSSDEAKDILKIAGRNSKLSKEHNGLYVDVPADGMYLISENFEEEAREFKESFKNIRVYVLDPYTLIISKISRLENKDFQDIEFLFTTQKLSLAILEKKYKQAVTTFAEEIDTYHFSLVKKFLKEKKHKKNKV